MSKNRFRSTQLFRVRFSYKLGKAYSTMSKVIMDKSGFRGCLITPQGFTGWWKETAQTRSFLPSRSLLLNDLEPQSSKTKLLLPIMPIDIVAYAFTLLWDNLCRNSYIPANLFRNAHEVLRPIARERK